MSHIAFSPFLRASSGHQAQSADLIRAVLKQTIQPPFRRVFQIRLSPPQLAAVMASFDKDNDGAVNCAEFLLQFFLIGFQVNGDEACVLAFCIANLADEHTP